MNLVLNLVLNNAVTDNMALKNMQLAGNNSLRMVAGGNAAISGSMNQHNLSLCDKIENDQIKVSCRDSLLQSLAISSKNASICDEISNTPMVEGCKEVVARRQAS